MKQAASRQDTKEYVQAYSFHTTPYTKQHLQSQLYVAKVRGPRENATCAAHLARLVVTFTGIIILRVKLNATDLTLVLCAVHTDVTALTIRGGPYRQATDMT